MVWFDLRYLLSVPVLVAPERIFFLLQIAEVNVVENVPQSAYLVLIERDALEHGAAGTPPANVQAKFALVVTDADTLLLALLGGFR